MITASRRTLSQGTAYVLAAGIVGLALFASGIPSPLYATYRELWGFSSAVLTLVYAVYAFGVLTSLILAGRLSDAVGRRPVLLAALGTLMASTTLYIFADSVAWLFAARAVQGLATGLAISAAGAALVELHPRQDPVDAGLANGVASAGGVGLGVLVSSALIEFLPAPRVVPFLVLLGVFAIAFVGVWRMPEPVEHRTRPRLTPQRPSVPPAARRPFLLASLGAISAWSIGGLFLSLGPQLTAELFHTTNHLLAGVGVFALSGSAAVAQLAFGRRPSWAGATGGSIALSAGMVLIVLAASSESTPLFLAGAIVGGAGFGVAFLGALRILVGALPAEHRAGVLSAFYIVSYLALSLPAIAAGFVVQSLGLEQTFEIFGSAVSALALIVAFEGWRARPRKQTPKPAAPRTAAAEARG
jgi:MFS family permease